MTWVLNLVYLGLLTVLSPVILYRSWRHGRYRRGLKEKLLGQLPVCRGTQPTVWFHAVSVGEVLQLARVVEAFQAATNGRFQVLVTSSTDTGYELALSRCPNCTVSWFPLDFSWSVTAGLRRVRPVMVVLMELELWPNFLTACRRQGVTTALINARLSDRSFRGYQRLRPLIRPLLQQFSLVAAQTQTYAERLQQLGAPPHCTHVTGSVKFDNVQSDRSHPATQHLRSLLKIRPDDTVFIAGSTQAPEEQLALQAWLTLRQDTPSVRFILVPRHRERFDEVADLVRSAGCRLVRRTELTAETPADPEAVILLDTMGELSACWGLADLAFVGGSFGPREGQNMLEPAAFGAAVLFGPRTGNFRDVVNQLLAADAAVRIPDQNQFVDCLRSVAGDLQRRQQLGTAARNLVLSQQGALDQTTRLLVSTVMTDRPSEVQNRFAA